MKIVNIEPAEQYTIALNAYFETQKLKMVKINK